MRYSVIVVSGPGAGRRFDISSVEARVGRAIDCEIAIDPAADVVSQVHGRLSVKGSRLVFEDTSTNGTFVHNRPLREVIVETGMVMQLGRSGPRVRFDILDAGRDAALKKTHLEGAGVWEAPAGGAPEGPQRPAAVVGAYPPMGGSYAPAAGSQALALAGSYPPAPAAGAYAMTAHVPGSRSGYGPLASPVHQGMPMAMSPDVGVAQLAFGLAAAHSTESDARDRDRSQLKVLAIFYGILTLYPLSMAVIASASALSALRFSIGAGLFLGVVAALLWLGLILDGLMAFALATERWHTFCLFMAVLCCLAFPVGTVLGVCCLMVLTRASTKRLFAGSPAVPPWMAPYWPGRSQRA